jgi:hypothetical protein
MNNCSKPKTLLAGSSAQTLDKMMNARNVRNTGAVDSDRKHLTGRRKAALWRERFVFFIWALVVIGIPLALLESKATKSDGHEERGFA